MQLKRLRETQDGLLWPQETDLPVISWQSCKTDSKGLRPFSLMGVL
jgi:stearoyl-CoA desaturase (Delta-9 desaturase)